MRLEDFLDKYESYLDPLFKRQTPANLDEAIEKNWARRITTVITTLDEIQPAKEKGGAFFSRLPQQTGRCHSLFRSVPRLQGT